MKCTGLFISMVVGVAVGAVVTMMLPKECAARKLVDKAANKVEDAACKVGGKISNKIDEM